MWYTVSARVAIKRTPCCVARGNPSQKTVIGNTFPPFFLKIIYESPSRSLRRLLIYTCIVCNVEKFLAHSTGCSNEGTNENAKVGCGNIHESEGGNR